MRLKRHWRWLLVGAGGLMAAGAVTLWLMFQHIPAWYRPARIPPADLQRVRDDLAATYDSLGAALNMATEPFEFRLTQEQINAWLAAREAIDPMTREWLPPSLSDPVVVLEQDGVRLGATYSGSGLRAIVSAKLHIDARTDGIFVRLDEVSGGSVGLPESLIRQGLEAADGRLGSSLERAGVRSADGRSRARLGGLAEGLILPNVGSLPGSGHRFRLIDVELEPEAVVFTLERLPGQTTSRRNSP